MSENQEIEKKADTESSYAGFRREDEHSGDWLERVLFKPATRLDIEPVKEKLNTIVSEKERSKAELFAVYLELNAWASSRPPAEQKRTFDAIGSQMRVVQEEHQRQGKSVYLEALNSELPPPSYTDRLRQHLLRFAEMVGGALSLLGSASQIFAAETEGAAITAEESISQVHVQAGVSSSPPQPRVLVPDSDVDA
ncbi:hypothetical protein M408DRAFT_22815 [Serendipita vermifera MAFF 305830]|uniref:Uncharacterized protein n=1 Tax=Serendipita vermifera MAFF 305830 TaxID=933852 RepID=A0A0C2WTG1_SERVB|nr:hypothetical protein M408DRAFT_22815 [Serendipita vermifera MAFF 305830]